MDLHDVLSDAQRREINETARNYTPTADDIKELARATGLTAGTVRRWFGPQENPRPLIPRTVNGASMADAENDFGRSAATRLALGLLISGGLENTPQLTGERGRDFYTYETIADAASVVVDIARGQGSEAFYWLGGAFESLTLAYELDGTIALSFDYARFGDGEGYEDIYPEPPVSEDETPMEEAPEVQ